MKKNLLALFVATFALTTSSFATIFTVTVADFSFTPSSLPSVHVGDTIKFQWSSGSHTTTSTSVPSGAATWDQPMNSSSTTFMYKTTVAGSYSYHCTPHASMGMAGTFTVLSTANVPSATSGSVLNVYPNPTAGIVHVPVAMSAIPAYVMLTDINGKTVFTSNLDGYNNTIDVSNIPNGTYHMTVLQMGTVNKQQLVVSH